MVLCNECGDWILESIEVMSECRRANHIEQKSVRKVAPADAIDPIRTTGDRVALFIISVAQYADEILRECDELRDVRAHRPRECVTDFARSLQLALPATMIFDEPRKRQNSMPSGGSCLSKCRLSITALPAYDCKGELA